MHTGSAVINEHLGLVLAPREPLSGDTKGQVQHRMGRRQAQAVVAENKFIHLYRAGATRRQKGGSVRSYLFPVMIPIPYNGNAEAVLTKCVLFVRRVVRPVRQLIEIVAIEMLVIEARVGACGRRAPVCEAPHIGAFGEAVRFSPMKRQVGRFDVQDRYGRVCTQNPRRACVVHHAKLCIELKPYARAGSNHVPPAVLVRFDIPSRR
mmetsp:Transcript_8090/g.25276  ORF Transcript_8090/g.25276 Transcript_8090/m.25276 type:complete len:207 (+) Transcript_8090:313-933(+)